MDQTAIVKIVLILMLVAAGYFFVRSFRSEKGSAGGPDGGGGVFGGGDACGGGDGCGGGD